MFTKSRLIAVSAAGRRRGVLVVGAIGATEAAPPTR
jgi:hypothetical protein